MSESLNVLDRTSVFDTIVSSRAPTIDYQINGHDYSMGYYLADGIYPG